PVVALSAHVMRSDRDRALALGCDGFITKPIDDEGFERAVLSFLRTEPGRPAEADGPKPEADGRKPEAATSWADRPLRSPVRPGPVREAGRPRRVLVVDDNPGVLDLLREYLQSAGFEVLVATDGHSALEAVERDAPELVVLDVMLPGLDGYEVTARL